MKMVEKCKRLFFSAIFFVMLVLATKTAVLAAGQGDQKNSASGPDNEPTVQYATVKVNKVWGEGTDSSLIEQVAVKLYQDDEEYKEEILNAENNWSCEWENIPIENEDGNKYVYYIEEVEVRDNDGSDVKLEYSIEYSSDTTTNATLSNASVPVYITGETNITITNTRPTGSLTVKKAWVNEDKAEDLKVKVQLYQDGSLYTPGNLAAEDVTVTLEKDAWSYTWSDLPIKKGESYYKYSVKEVAVESGEDSENIILNYETEYSGEVDFEKSDTGTITITNTKPTDTNPVGSLTVKKEWVNENKAEDLKVKVQLYQDGSLYNPEHLAVEAVTVTLEKDAWSHTWSDLPIKNGESYYKYSIREVAVESGDGEDSKDITLNYKIEYSDEVDFEKRDTGTITITNTKPTTPPPPEEKTGSLTIRKEISGPEEAGTKEYKFKVTNANSETPSFDREVSITGSGSATISDLPFGTYKVEEIGGEMEGYIHNVSISNNGQAVLSSGSLSQTVTVTNTYTKPSPETGSLTIRKEVSGSNEAGTKEYKFKVTNADGETPSFEREVTITGNGSATISDLPFGTYKVEEIGGEIEGYNHSVTISNNGQAVLSSGSLSQTITVTNTYTKPSPETGSLTIRKEISGAKEAETKEYKFKVTNADSGTPSFDREVSITGSGSATISDLPFGTYKVEEIGGEIEGYILDVSVSKNGEAVLSAESSAQTITVRNTYNQPETGNLLIRKTVTGSAGETQKDFTFTINLTDAEGNALPGTYNYTGSKTGTITSGGTITLKHSERVTISNLPKDTRYQVVEKEANADRYVTALEGGTGSDQGVIKVGETAVVGYINTRTSRRGGGGGNPNPGTPPVLPELPNSGDPDSPDTVIIVEDGVPTSYVRVQDPETEELIYVPEEDVPLYGLPKTGDRNRGRWLEMLAIISMFGIGALLVSAYQKKKKVDR